MITSVNHTGFVVSDLEKSVAFYRDVIGLELVWNLEREGGPISHLLGYENTHIKGAMLRSPDGNHLELIQYINPEASDRPRNAHRLERLISRSTLKDWKKPLTSLYATERSSLIRRHRWSRAEWCATSKTPTATGLS